jgi:MinD superfamily P-loop ATPase
VKPVSTPSPPVIAVASGKGGTGKTTIAVSLALSLEKALFLDCDVEEPNAHIFLKPALEYTKNAHILIPRVDEEKCTGCGLCSDVCSYSALAVLPDGKGQKEGKKRKGRVLLFDHLCHGCGACSRLCPQGAIREVPKPIGVVEAGQTGDIRFVHGRLTIGEILSPSLIRQVRRYAEDSSSSLPVIIDAPPGTSCPMVASVKGADFCILVAEPTPFGLSDLRQTVDVIRRMDIPFAVILNRDGIGDGRVEEYCASEGIEILMKIPFDREIARFYAEGIPLVEARPRFRAELLKIYEGITVASGEAAQ